MTGNANAILYSIVQALPATLFVVDEHGRYLNVVGEQALPAHDGGTLIGKHVREVLPESVAEGIMQSLQAALDTGAMRRQEYRLSASAAGGSQAEDGRWYEGRFTPLPQEPGEPRQVAWLSQDITDRKRLESEVDAAALIDPVTELSNQRHFMRVLDHEILRQERYREPVCLLLLEVDHYETIRDSFGTDIADTCLREAARLMRQQLRHSDILGRLEDAEFGILLLNTPLNWAKEVAERIRARIAATPLTLPQKTLRLTVSGGVAAVREGETASSLLWRTEEALFQSESGGRSSIRIG